ncbi:MAG: hypothetical protein JXA42_11490 [Anaerolineales bacterium]|nr:hypothetical protein [Anaerolineales bacterium]
MSEPVLKNAVESLIREKRGGKELDFGPRIDPISVYIERELDRLDMHDIEFKNQSAPIEKLDQIFFDALEETWKCKIS